MTTRRLAGAGNRPGRRGGRWSGSVGNKRKRCVAGRAPSRAGAAPGGMGVWMRLCPLLSGCDVCLLLLVAPWEEWGAGCEGGREAVASDGD